MQDRQIESESESLVESPASGITICAEQDFNNRNRQKTEEISAGEEAEFIQTHYSPRGVIFMYFKGEASSQVDKHFSRTLAEMCCLSEEDDSGVENSNMQGVVDRLHVSNLQFDLNSKFLLEVSQVD